MVWVNDLDHKIILGDNLEKLPTKELEAWFDGRNFRLAASDEALDFIDSLPKTHS